MAQNNEDLLDDALLQMSNSASDAETEPMANLTTVAEDSISKPAASNSNSKSSKKSSTTPTDKSKMGRERLVRHLNRAEKDLAHAKQSVKTEKEAKRKLYSSLVKIAQELEKTKTEHAELQAIVETNASLEAKMNTAANISSNVGGVFSSRSVRSSDNFLYELSSQPVFWREPQLLPGLTEYSSSKNRSLQLSEEISFTDLFLDVVVVTGFSRVGFSIHDYGLNWAAFAFFCIFLQIWGKEAAYSTRFDTTDSASIIITLLNSFLILFGTISADSDTFQSEDGTRMMMVAASSSFLYLLQHVKIVSTFWNKMGVENVLARKYAIFTALASFCECSVWLFGIYYLANDSPYRWVVFLVGILVSIRIPRSFLPNDFHAATTKRGVLFILLLGYNLQSLVMVASPFFDYANSPTTSDYAFMGGSCLLLFCIKLLYCDDDPNRLRLRMMKHMHILVNRLAGFFFDLGQMALLMSTIILGSGLDLLTSSYLAATAALPNNAKQLICLGFTMVVLSIAFLKSLAIIRVPTNAAHRRMFYLSYFIQLCVTLSIAFTSWKMTDITNNAFVWLQTTDMELLYVLSGFALLLVIIGSMHKSVELSLIEVRDESTYIVYPFGFWACLKESSLQIEEDVLRERHPMVRASVSADRIHLLGGDEKDVYDAVEETERNLNVMGGNEIV